MLSCLSRKPFALSLRRQACCEWTAFLPKGPRRRQNGMLTVTSRPRKMRSSKGSAAPPRSPSLLWDRDVDCGARAKGYLGHSGRREEIAKAPSAEGVKAKPLAVCCLLCMRRRETGKLAYLPLPLTVHVRLSVSAQLPPHSHLKRR